MKRKDSKPLCILMTTDPVGGVWSYTMELCQELRRYSIEVVLAVMGGRISPSQQRALDHMPHVTSFHHSGRLEWMDDPWTDISESGLWLKDLADRFQPSLVHLSGYAHADLAWKIPKVVVAHSCVASWWKAVKREALPARYSEYRNRVVSGLQAADMVVAPSRSMLDSLEENYGVSFRGCVIANGCHTGGYEAAVKSWEHFIFSAGRLWDEAKNIQMLDAIAPRLKWPVRVAGPQSFSHESDGREWKHLENVGCLSRGALTEELQKAPIYAAPALYEPFGLGVLEAALSGCALVLSDIPSFREIWDDAAIFVSPENSEEWICTLNGLAENSERVRALAEAARKRARKFSAEKMARHYVDLYQGLSGVELHRKEALAA